MTYDKAREIIALTLNEIDEDRMQDTAYQEGLIDGAIRAMLELGAIDCEGAFYLEDAFKEVE